MATYDTTKHYARDVINMNPYDEIKGYCGSVLIIHGNKDKIVDISYAYKAKDIYGNNCNLQVLSKAGHGFNKNDDKLALSLIEKIIK